MRSLRSAGPTMRGKSQAKRLEAPCRPIPLYISQSPGTHIRRSPSWQVSCGSDNWQPATCNWRAATSNLHLLTALKKNHSA